MSNILKTSRIKMSQSIREVIIGTDKHNMVKIGSQSAMPFVNQDGNITYKPQIAVEIQFLLPEKYPSELVRGWESSITEPVKWANNAKNNKANLIALRLSGDIDSNSQLKKFINTAIEIIKSTNLPLSILGTNNREIDKKVLPVIAEKMEEYNCLIGPIEEDTYKYIVPACRDYGHCVIARTPIDVNLAKQLNILISELGFSPDKIVMDPNMGGLGYGLDYAYSVVEKIRIAAFEGDNMLNMPIIVFSGEESWRTKEAKANISNSEWGDVQTRATMWESLTTSSMIMAGADIVIMRYLPSIKSISEFIKGIN
ncbi:MAG: acetyl-CoA decarbonylase/synthase complex subunit delta [Cyanobacteriota bacterium]